MNYTDFLDEIAFDLLSIMKSDRFAEEIPTEDYSAYVNDKVQWNNYRYKSDNYRFAHLERYGDDKLQVLHLTTFPKLEVDTEIFGFDAIVANNKPLGCYFDLSPTTKNKEHETTYLRSKYEKVKALPEWAEDIFSRNYCFVESQSDVDFCTFCLLSVREYREYMKYKTRSYTISRHTSEMQNRYCEVQSKNPRTYSVLKQKIGEDRAKSFMQDVLFPKIK